MPTGEHWRGWPRFGRRIHCTSSHARARHTHSAQQEAPLTGEANTLSSLKRSQRGACRGLTAHDLVGGHGMALLRGLQGQLGEIAKGGVSCGLNLQICSSSAVRPALASRASAPHCAIGVAVGAAEPCAFASRFACKKSCKRCRERLCLALGRGAGVTPFGAASASARPLRESVDAFPGRGCSSSPPPGWLHPTIPTRYFLCE